MDFMIGFLTFLVYCAFLVFLVFIGFALAMGIAWICEHKKRRKKNDNIYNIFTKHNRL